MKLTIVKANNAVSVYATVSEETLEALKATKSFQSKDKEGKVTFTLSYGNPEVKTYGVSINQKNCLIRQVLISDANEKVLNELTKELAMEFGKVKPAMDTAEKELVKQYKAAKKAAEEIEIVEVGENNEEN